MARIHEARDSNPLSSIKYIYRFSGFLSRFFFFLSKTVVTSSRAATNASSNGSRVQVYLVMNVFNGLPRAG